MTGRPAAFSALALASTASVADSEMAATRAETLVGMGSIVAPGGRCLAAIYSAGSAGPRGLAVRRGGPIGRTLLGPAAELLVAAACPSAICVWVSVFAAKQWCA